MRRLLPVILFSAAFMSAPPLAFADTKEKKKAENPVVASYEGILDDLNKENARHFSVIYSNYNIIKVVHTVKDSVKTAINACAEKHEAMKKPLERRYQAWEASVDPILDEAQANIENMVLVQDYTDPKDIKKLFKLIDKTRAEEEKAAEKVPSTSEKSCKFLLNKMDDTQDNMIRHLRATLISLPLSIQREKEEEMKKSEGAEADQAAKSAEKSGE